MHCDQPALRACLCVICAIHMLSPMQASSMLSAVLQAVGNTILVIVLVGVTSVVLFGINYVLAELSKVSYRR